MKVGRDEIQFKVRAGDAAHGRAAAEVLMQAGGGPPILHRHAASELYRVQAGELTFYVADAEGKLHRRVAPSGETVAIPGGREHTIRNESAAAAKAFAVYSPGQQMEAFALAAAELAADGAAGPAEIAAVAERHGIELTRPIPRDPAAELAPLRERWAMLLRTRRRDGSWVETPVNVAVEGERAYFGTPATSAKVKRLRNFDQVEVAPCTLRGRPVGETIEARARRLDGADADRAERLLVSRYPFVHRAVVPLELRLKRAAHALYEISVPT